MPSARSLVLTTEASGAQDGYVVSGTFNQTSTEFRNTVTPTLLTLGLVFDLALDTSYDGDIKLEPPIIQAGSLALTGSGINIGGTTLASVWLVPEHAPDPFSDSLLPGSRDEILLGWGTSALTGWDSKSPVLRFPLSTEADTVRAPGEANVPTAVASLAALAGETRNYYENYALLRRWTADSQWNGKLTLYVALVVAGGTFGVAAAEHATVAAPTLTLTLWPFHTGHEVGSFRRARATYSDRLGMPVFTTDLVDDDYQPGLRVLPDQYDPEDPPDQYRSPATEGRLDPENE